ncbi:hypothetical protein BGX26_010909 [Mortierella sp. AD094]|nr:hypothetical protein BGX26_010909 [Mortierella sp. AD094]
MDPISLGPANGSRSGSTSSSGPGVNSNSAPGATSSSEPGANSGSGPGTSLTPITNKKPAALRNLQPRAAAAMDFNDNFDSDEEFGGLLSEDYKAQRKTTKELVDFLNSGPPEPPPGSSLRQQQQKSTATTGDEDKKKWFFLQKLRSKKSNSSIGNGSSVNLGSGNKRSSALLNGTSSNISSTSGMTMSKGKNGEDVPTATLPNGKKYIMIAVDFKEPEKGAINGSGGVGSSGASTLSVAAAASRRQSRVPEETDNLSLLGGAPKRTSMMSSFLDDASGTGVGDARRRSAIPNSGASEASKLVLDGGSFLLDGLSLDTNSYLSQGAGVGGASGDLQRSLSLNSRGENGSIGDMSRNGSKRISKVTFSTPRVTSVFLDEATVSEALEQRIASHKAKQQQKNGSTDTKTTSSTGPSSASASTSTQDFPEIILPKPVSRKKVRHVQIQTQHSIMRPMYTQTEPYENLVQDLEVKEWSTQTTTSTRRDGSSGTMNSGRASSKVASLVASLTQPTAATTATTSAATSPTTATSPNPFSTSTTTTAQDGTSTSASAGTTTSAATTTDAEITPSAITISPQDELAQLRQQNALLQSQVTSLERDLAAEMRARTRTAVAMQDTRVKFEMLSEMAFEKLKEMIFHRQVLDKEMQELRAQVDMQSEASVIQQGEMLFRQEQLQMQMQMQQQQQQFHQLPTA